MSELIRTVLCCLAALGVASAGEALEEGSAQESKSADVQESRSAREEGASLVTDFIEDTKGWRNIDDGVMGGVSFSRISIAKGLAVFEGKVSLENNGGFASVRSLPKDHDFSKAKGLLLRVRGDGKRYAFRLRTSRSYDGISYESRFKTVADKWTTIELPFEAFRPVYRGRLVWDAKPLDPKSVKTLGFLISDKQAGPFRLEIDWIKAYAGDAEGK